MTPLRKGMFTGNIKLGDGVGRWMAGLGRLVRGRSGPKPPAKPQAAGRPEPETEGEMALYQAMGWKDSAWEE